MQEKISIVIATYNGEAFLRQQLESVFIQLPENSEIVISDNGSTDNTINVINQYNHPRVKLLINKEKKGVINNFENALKFASGEIIFLCDQDDIWKPDKVAICYAYLSKYDIVVSDCEIIDNKNNIIVNSYFSRRNSGKGVIKNLWANTYLGCCIAFRRKILEVVLPFPKNITMHDIWFGFVGEIFFKTHFIAQILVSYRMHDDNVSPTTIGISPYGLLSKFRFRWNIIKYFPLLISRRWKI